MKDERLNVLEIPNGGEFQVTLADGSRVWLNAGTRLTYPIAFCRKKNGGYVWMVKVILKLSGMRASLSSWK